MQTEPSKAASPNRKRRWFQFSLRTLLIFTTICAIASAWLGRKIEQKRKERNAAEAIGRLGGSANYSDDCYEDGLPHMSAAGDNSPGWLTRLLRALGLDRTFNVVHVDFRGDLKASFVRDPDLAVLVEFPHLLDLELCETGIGDEGLQHIAGLKELRILDLRRTRVTDAGLRYLVGLKELRSLDVDETLVTWHGIEDLQRAIPKVVVIPKADWLKAEEGLDRIFKQKPSPDGPMGPINAGGL